MGFRLRILICLGFVGCAALFIAWRALRLVYRRLRKRPFAVGRLDYAALGLICLGFLASFYGAVIEPRWLEVESVELALLAAGSEPVTIVHISDLHAGRDALLEPRLPAVISELSPDLIVFTGDAVNSPAGLVHFQNLLSELARLAPVYTVRGNRGLGPVADIDLVGATGARELEGEAVDLVIRGSEIRLVGAGRPSGWGRVRGLLRQRPEVPAIFLGHSPDAIFDVAKWGAELALVGHTHGGQVALPFYGALFTASRFDKRFEAGLYEVDGAYLYVNRGLGFQATLPRLRLFARPEVTKIVLVGQEALPSASP